MFRTLSSLVLYGLIVTPAYSLEPEAASAAASNSAASNSVRSHFVDSRLYPDYLASPSRSTFSAQVMSFDRTDIVDTSEVRYDLKMGATFNVLRFYDVNTPRYGWQFNVEAGFHGQFDADNDTDNIGWDGVYAFSLERRASEQFAQRLGLHHVSSHVGDEYIERTGRMRIGYTRHELRYGAAWSMTPRWLVYGELGWGFNLSNDALMEPWRAEIGSQYEHPDWWRDVGWYAALDVTSYQESDWTVNTSMQLGFFMRRNGRLWRAGFEFYNGRAQIGEFFQDRERYAGFGIWVDL